MAMAVGGGRGGRRGGRHRTQPIAGINVTPMVDVMLVLLVIFMVTAPLLTSGVPVDLPSANAKPITGDDRPLTVSVKADGSIWLSEDTTVQLDELAPRLKAMTNNNPDARIFVRGDAGVQYGRMIEVLANLQSAGMSKVALITQTPKTAPPSSGKTRQK
jgi:biopolymer transport protein TolR